MDGTRIVMVRHGESLAQEQRFVGGHKGCRGLSERGRAQVEALRDRLAGTGELGDEVALYASIMPRAVETASILAPALGAGDILQDCDLCEHHPGEGDGLPWEEFDALYPRPDGSWDPDFRRDPGGETWNEMAARVSVAIDRLVAEHAGGTVVVACHGGVIVQAMVRFLAMDPGGDVRRAWFSPENASITEWRRAINPYRDTTLDWELVRFNDYAHLVGSPLLPVG
ncbi:MAG TPA: histidine phosphatase family protein [Acidimicrobiales bacterium]|nr:histidine phosphatase family protein [Acidimicrobiales bacterium]